MAGLGLTFGAALVALSIGAAHAAGPVVGLVTKTDANPFFVTMKEAALRKAGELGVELRAFAGEHDGDFEAQVDAVEALTAAGASAILIAPSRPAALADTVHKARAAGVLVIALDTPFGPAGTADATFATDNFRAGELIGRWARARLGAAASTAKIATLDLSEARVTVDVLRNQGFLKGFGIDIKDPATMYDEDDPRIVGSGATLGSEAGGRAAMERLIQETLDIDLVYAVNEPAAAGAHAALKAFGMDEGVTIVTVDGGCPGVRSVAAGAIGATAMQYPGKMARLGVEAAVEFARSGRMPEGVGGLAFQNTGVSLITDHAIPGIPSLSVAQGLKACWG